MKLFKYMWNEKDYFSFFGFIAIGACFVAMIILTIV